MANVIKKNKNDGLENFNVSTNHSTVSSKQTNNFTFSKNNAVLEELSFSENLNNILDTAGDVVENSINPVSVTKVVDSLDGYIESGINRSDILSVFRKDDEIIVCCKNGVIFHLEETSKDNFELVSIGIDGSDFEFKNSLGFVKDDDYRSNRGFELGEQEKIEYVSSVDGVLKIWTVTQSGMHSSYEFNTNDGSTKCEIASYTDDGKYYKEHKCFVLDSNGVFTSTDYIAKTETQTYAGKSFIDGFAKNLSNPYFADHPDAEPSNPFVVTLSDGSEVDYEIVTDLTTGKKDYYMQAYEEHGFGDYVSVATYDPNTNQTEYHYRKTIIDCIDQYHPDSRVSTVTDTGDSTYNGGPDLKYAGEYGTGRQVVDKTNW